MKYPKKELAQLVLEYCVTYGIDQVVISPGSRNAPLIIGFVNHPKIKTYSIVDERCAAFFALGIAQQTRKPVAIVCTSGSALLNYYPAVAEAFYSNIPLIVISADRPKHLIDVGDGQTIRQESVFLNHSEFNANLDDILPIKDNAHLLQKAFHNCIEKMGPVHINVPFDEPLYDEVEELTIKRVEAVHYEDSANKTPLELADFAEIWNASSRKMILVGEHFPDPVLQKQLETFAVEESVLVLTETTSNLHHDTFIRSIDSLIFPLNEQEKLAFQPEILITFGGMVVSKRIKKILRNYQPKHHWHVGSKKAPNTFHCLNHHFRIDEASFFNHFLEIINPVRSEYRHKWLSVKKQRENRHEKYLTEVVFSDLKVFDIILKSIPKGVLLQASNSSIIRYLQLFKMDTTIQTFCNRGTSGIDGSTSTAIGASLTTNKQTVFITGDISFFYDSNGLWNTYIKNSFRIILINNSGGGIFKIIPGPQESNALDYFETTHNMNASNLCDMHGLEYYAASSETALNDSLKEFYDESNSSKLLEIFTPRNSNDILLKDYFKYLE